MCVCVRSHVHMHVCVCVCVCVYLSDPGVGRELRKLSGPMRGRGGSEAFPFSALAHHSFCNFRTFPYLFSVLHAGG